VFFYREVKIILFSKFRENGWVPVATTLKKDGYPFKKLQQMPYLAILPKERSKNRIECIEYAKFNRRKCS
jgi:hypothetical protein